MDTSAPKLEMTTADLLGYTVDDLRCNRCSGAFCPKRTTRLVDGKPFVMCTCLDAVKEVLTAFESES